jgi:hypothetical protein
MGTPELFNAICLATQMPTNTPKSADDDFLHPIL